MAVPRSAAPGGRSRGESGGYALGALGLGVAVGVLVATYSTLVAVTAALPYLSTTAIVLVAVAAWALIWVSLELAYSQFWRATLPPC